MKVTGFLLALVLTSSPSAFPQEKKLEPLVVSYASVSGSRAPLWIAKEMGLFEKYGLDGKPIFVPAGYPSVSALISGDVQFIATGGSEGVAAYAHGAPRALGLHPGALCLKPDLPPFEHSPSRP